MFNEPHPLTGPHGWAATVKDYLPEGSARKIERIRHRDGWRFTRVPDDGATRTPEEAAARMLQAWRAHMATLPVDLVQDIEDGVRVERVLGRVIEWPFGPVDAKTLAELDPEYVDWLLAQMDAHDMKRARTMEEERALLKA